jgi:ppGpp synthetase/RelA/SpoT-type nucleotidyltranferase
MPHIEVQILTLSVRICAALRHDLIDKRQKTIFEIKNLYEKAHYIILFIDRHSDR